VSYPAATGDSGDVNAISGEGFLLRFFDAGTEDVAGTGVGVGVALGIAVAAENGGERLGRLSNLSKDV